MRIDESCHADGRRDSDDDIHVNAVTEPIVSAAIAYFGDPVRSDATTAAAKTKMTSRHLGGCHEMVSSDADCVATAPLRRSIAIREPPTSTTVSDDPAAIS